MADEILARLGERVRTLRDLHGITQAALAARAGLQRSSIANLEAGRQNVPVTTLAVIAAELKATVGTLLGEVPMPDLPNVCVSATYTVDCSRCLKVAEVDDAEQAEQIRVSHFRSHIDGSEEVVPDA